MECHIISSSLLGFNLKINLKIYLSCSLCILLSKDETYKTEYFDFIVIELTSAVFVQPFFSNIDYLMVKTILK